MFFSVIRSFLRARNTLLAYQVKVWCGFVALNAPKIVKERLVLWTVFDVRVLALFLRLLVA